MSPRIEKFNIKPGKILAGKYKVLSRIGTGWEGEVYHVRERGTGVYRAAKIFFPHRDRKGKATRFLARKMHKLRKCPVLVQYHTQEQIIHQGTPVKMLVSEFVEGDILTEFRKKQSGKRLRYFEALHLLRAMAEGVSNIHKLREYHGDIHEENVIVARRGVWFEVKLFDMFNYGASSGEHMSDDVVDLIRLFYDCLGGAKYYAKHPQYVKDICLGLKHSLIKKKFKNAGKLFDYLNTFDWD